MVESIYDENSLFFSFLKKRQSTIKSSDSKKFKPTSLESFS